jgi:drug/metabolite transporter (DMT)-like permease
VFVSELLISSFLLFTYGLIPTAKKLLKLKQTELLVLIFMALLGGILGPLFWFYGLQMTSAVNGSLFGKADIVFNLLLAHILLKERIEKGHVLAICSILFGIVLVTCEGFTQGITVQFGDLIIIMATISCAAASILYRYFIPEVEPQVVLLTRSLIAIAAFSIFSLLTPQEFYQELSNFPLALLPTLIAFAFFSRYINGIFGNYALEYVPITTITLVSTLDIFIASVFAMLYLGESIAPYQVIGGIFLVLGNVLLAIFHTPFSHEQVKTHLQQRPL